MTILSRSNRTPFRGLAILARIGVVAFALLLAACQAPAAPSASAPPIAVGSPGPSGPASSPDLPIPSSDPAPSTPAGTPTPTPTPADPVAWSKPVVVKDLVDCTSVVLAVDESGGRHLAAACGDGTSAISYAASADGGAAWDTSHLKPPAGRYELDPQLAFSGNTLFLAYTRVAPDDGGCGDDGLADVGVWYRTRTMPSGDWSEPTQIGRAADRLEALRVSGSVIHATVHNDKDKSTAYVRVEGGAGARFAIGDARGSTALRIGDDGKARIAYESGKGIGYGSLDGDRFVGKTIVASGYAHAPVLTLAPGNTAYLLYAESYHDGGCTEPDPLPTFGTYFATNAGGSWESSRLTTLIGSSSMTIDPATGDLHVLVSDYRRMVHFHRPAAGGVWVNETLTRDHPSGAVIRQDPTSGALVVAYIADPDPADPKLEVAVMAQG